MPLNSQASVGVDDIENMSFNDILNCIAERTSDPVISRLLSVARTKIPPEHCDCLKREERNRTIVVSGLDECPPDLSLSERCKDLDGEVFCLLDKLRVDCKPSAVYRLGNYNSSRPRLVKVVFPSSFHWRVALSNARLLHGVPGLENVFVRWSMTLDERKRDIELRQLAKERNAGKAKREWVVYRNELKHVSDLPSFVGNLRSLSSQGNI